MRKAIDATPPWARTPVCNGQPWIPSLPKSSVFALLLEPWTNMDKVSERAVFFPYDWIVVTQLHCAALKHQCSLPSGSPCRLLQDCIHHILLHPFSLRPCERSRQLIVEDPEGGLSHGVDLRHSLFPFRSRILQGHILGESLSCVTCYQEFPNVQQDPLYRSLELTDSPFEDRWYRC